MKKNVIIALVVLSTLDLFSQIDKGKTLIAADGNFHQSTTGFGATTSKNSVHGKYFNVGASVGYFFTNRFMVGFGLDYKSESEKRSSVMAINRYYQQEVMDIKAKVWLPNVHFGYYYPIVEKLFINANMKFSYGKLKGEYNTLIANAEQLIETSSLSSSSQFATLRALKNESEIDFSSVEVLPELTYFLTSKFCLSLGLGGAGYAMTDWSNDNSIWIVDFNPAYWTLGVKVSL